MRLTFGPIILNMQNKEQAMTEKGYIGQHLKSVHVRFLPTESYCWKQNAAGLLKRELLIKKACHACQHYLLW